MSKIHEIGERAYFRIGEHTVSVALEKVGPEEAKQWLEREHKNNRKLPGTVEKYKIEMASGEWLTTPEPIVVSRAGELINGGNRMRAIVLSGATVLLTVWRDFPDETFAVLDRNSRRTLVQAEQMAGDAMPKQCYHMGRAMVALDTGRGVVADSEAKRCAAILFPAWEELASDLTSVRIAGMSLRAPAQLAFCLAWLTSPVAVRSFLDELKAATDHTRVPPSAVRNFIRWYEGSVNAAGSQGQRVTALATASALRQFASGVDGHHIKPAPEAYRFWRVQVKHETRAA